MLSVPLNADEMTVSAGISRKPLIFFSDFPDQIILKLQVPTSHWFEHILTLISENLVKTKSSLHIHLQA